jgi:hypothetical protein
MSENFSFIVNTEDQSSLTTTASVIIVNTKSLPIVVASCGLLAPWMCAPCRAEERAAMLASRLSGPGLRAAQFKNKNFFSEKEKWRDR